MRRSFMGLIADEINRAIKDNHLKSHLLPSVYAEDLRTDIIEQYCNRNSVFMWESFKDCIHYQNSNAWSLIHDYVKENECIMLFDKSEDENVFLISNGRELQQILEDSFGFEFYITDKNYSYLLCFNHHDILYGAGKAKEWINEILKGDPDQKVEEKS